MDLSPLQRQAVEHGDGPLLIIAGAGTGKTLVITHRIAHLITTKRARPEEILALTFTDKAAREMEERVDLLVPYGYTDVRISTFHAFGDRVLRDEALALGLATDFRVLSRPEQLIFLRERLFELPLERYRPLGNPTRHLDALATLISRAKDEDVDPDAYAAFARSLAERAGVEPKASNKIEPKASNREDPAAAEYAREQAELAAMYRRYQELLAVSGLVDFGDQVTLALRLFRSRADILKRYQGRFRYILVDEFQDTNYAQFQLVQLLAEPHRNLTVVGDDDQAIFKFRGASISNILSFARVYPQAQRVVLTENHRSGQAILDAAYRLIRNNDPDRLEAREGIEKRLTATRRDAGLVRHIPYDTGSAEADGVAAIIAEQAAAGRPYRDFAILVRSNDEADRFLRAMNVRGIPHRFSGNRGLYHRPEVRQLIAFLRILADPHDSRSLYALASADPYRIPANDLQECVSVAHRSHRSLDEVLRALVGPVLPLSPAGRGEGEGNNGEGNNGEGEQVSPLTEDLARLSAAGRIGSEARATAARLLTDLTRYREAAREGTAGTVLYRFLVDSGILHRLEREGAEGRIRNIARFFEIVRDFEYLTDDPSAAAFVRQLDLLLETGDDPAVAEPEPDQDAVNVLTVHKAKGLEFPVVFLVGLVEQRFPTRERSEPLPLPLELVREDIPSGDFHLQEERRLFYVGMTRARDELYLASARDYGAKTTVRGRKVSRFVMEALDLPPEKLKPAPSSALEAIARHAPPADPPGPVTAPAPLRPEDPLRLSHYQIDDYQTCPLKYKYRHILQIPIYQHHSVVYGSAIHNAISEYLKAKIAGEPYSADALIAAFDRSWRSEGFLSRAHEERRIAAGRQLLRRFYEKQEAEGRPPAAVEKEFSFVIGPNRVTGRWDRVDERDGEVVIVDYKSSEVRDAKEANRKTKESLQLSIYALGYRERFGRLPDRVELQFLESGMVGSAVKDENDVAETVEIIEQVAEGIRAREFAPRPTFQACRYCAYREICPHTAYHEGGG